jgi:DNA-directed RNA polymerase specialized sigma24 family protein
MSSRQAAEVMGINDEAFQALLARARRALKAKLGGIEV